MFENLLGLFTRTLILSARPLIAFTLPSDTAYSPTVPGGDTPCLTAGDARRVNPWTDDSATLRRRRCRTAAHFCTSELPPPRFQCDAAGVGIRVVCLSTGSPSLWLGYHPRLRMVHLCRRRLCMDADEGVILCCCGRAGGGSGYSLLISSNSYSFIKEKRLYICLQS